MKTPVSIHNSKKSISLVITLLLVGFIGFNSYATTYFTVANGAWGAAIWRVGSTTGAGSVLPTLFAGDILVIDDQVTIASGTVTVTPSITINLVTNSATRAKLIFVTGGKLALSSTSSVINLTNTVPNGPPVTNNPSIDGSGSGGSNTIDIGSGNEVWRAGDGDITGIGQLNQNSNNGSLPIKLSAFNAAQDKNIIALKWATSSEENFEKFVVERSSDGLTFESITEIEGAGDSKNELKYSYDDESPLIGTIYYRLKSVDFDGTFEYSKVVFVDYIDAKVVTVYPSPGNGSSINLSTNFSPEANDNIMIMDFAGSEVAKASVESSTAQIVFNTPLKSGTYFIKYASSGYNKVERFVVK